MNAAHLLIVAIVLAVLVSNPHPAEAQGDGRLNGALIGVAAGAGAGVAFTHAVRDSDLTFGQYTYGALIFGAIGAGVGLGVDALLDRSQSASNPPQRVIVAPFLWRGVRAVAVKWRW